MIFLLTGCGGQAFDAQQWAGATETGGAAAIEYDAGAGGAAGSVTIGSGGADRATHGSGGAAGRGALGSGGEEDSGTEMAAGGAIGAGGADAGDVTADAQFAPQCPLLMFLSGSTCIDEQPALLGDGTQGPAVDFQEAVAACAARGVRLCTESERENSCSDAGANFCAGPADTWEWSAGGCSSTGERRSPCCTVSHGFGECDAPSSGQLSSYRCCSSPRGSVK